MAKNKNRNLSKIGGTWYFRILWKGQTFKRSLGVSKESIARDLRDEYLNNLVKYNQLDAPVERDTQMTFGQMAKIWAKVHKKEVKYTTWPDYVSKMNCHILPVFKDRPISEISYMEILEFRNSIDVKAKTANNIMIPMKSVFDLAHTEGIIKENVMKKLKKLKEDDVPINPFSLQEIRQILGKIDPWYRSYAELLFFTGMRAGEANALTWKDYKEDMEFCPQLDINKTFVQGQDGPPKTPSSFRMIDCLPEVIEALKAQKKLTGQRKHIFLTKDGNRMTTDHFLKEVWVKALEKAGIEYRPPIQARHTFATMMISSGEDVGWVQNMMGHASLEMINRRYYKWKPRKTRNDGQAYRQFADSKAGIDKADVVDLSLPEKTAGHETEKIGSCTNIVPLDDFRQKKGVA